MKNKVWILVGVALLATACSRGITEPASPAPMPSSSTTTPVPGDTPPPAPPVPVPTPTPIPPPTPTPEPEGVVRYNAKVQFAHFFSGPKLFDDNFVIEIWEDRGEIWVHNTRLWIYFAQDGNYTALDKDATGGDTYTMRISIRKSHEGMWYWDMSGSHVMANGSMTRR